jgi:LuxR family maltose regulon positive regulatory protein
MRIFRGETEVPPSAWVRLKSRTLFSYLVCARPRRVHKEELIETLWPGVGPDRGAHSLQVVLSDLRRALTGGVARRDGRALVHRLGEHYCLDVGATGWVDAETFEAEYELGRQAHLRGDRERATVHLESSASLWIGDYLAEERFADWAEPRRQRIRDRYVDTLQRLVRLYEASGQLENAVATAKKLLTVDPYLEPYYRDLMRCLRQLGDHGGVIQAYLRCEQAMREGFDNDVSVETRRLLEVYFGSPVECVLQRHAAARRRHLPSLGRSCLSG